MGSASKSPARVSHSKSASKMKSSERKEVQKRLYTERIRKDMIKDPVPNDLEWSKIFQKQLREGYDELSKQETFKRI